MRLKGIGCLCAAIALSGCANTFGGVDVHHVTQKLTAISQPANVRSAYVMDTKICPEPPPDAALQAVANAAAKVSTNAGPGGELSGGLTTSMVQLAGRTQTVLIARDAFTANCILWMNGDIDKDAAEHNYVLALNLVQAIAKTDQAVAEGDAAKAKTEQAKAQTALIAAGAKSDFPATPDVDKDVAAIIKALSDNNGAFQPPLVAQFFGRADVKAVLPASDVSLLARQTDPGDLKDLLTGVLHIYARELAVIAAKFKG